MQLPEREEVSATIHTNMVHSQDDVLEKSGVLNLAQMDLLKKLSRGEVSKVGTLSENSKWVLQNFEKEYATLQRNQMIRDHQAKKADAYWNLSEKYLENLRRQDALIGCYQMNLEPLFTSKLWKLTKLLGRVRKGLTGVDAVQLEANFGTLYDQHQSARREIQPRIPVKRSAKVIAILAARNEEMYIGPCLEHLIHQGLEVLVLDNESSDDTVKNAEAFSGRGLIGIETVPYDGVMRWKDMLDIKVEWSRNLDADWFLHQDPDEFRTPPPGYRNLQSWITESDREGFNALNFTEYTFLPCRESPDHFHADFQKTLRWYYPFCAGEIRRLNAWKQQDQVVDLSTNGGHIVQFENLCPGPESGAMRHYLFLSPEHACKKYKTRSYDPAEVEKGWHEWRHRIGEEVIQLPSVTEMNFYQNDLRFSHLNHRDKHYPFHPANPA